MVWAGERVVGEGDILTTASRSLRICLRRKTEKPAANKAIMSSTITKDAHTQAKEELSQGTQAPPLKLLAW